MTRETFSHSITRIYVLSPWKEIFSSNITNKKLPNFIAENNFKIAKIDVDKFEDLALDHKVKGLPHL